MTLRAAVEGLAYLPVGAHKGDMADYRDRVLALIDAHSCYDPETLAADLAYIRKTLVKAAELPSGHVPIWAREDIKTIDRILAALEAGKAGGE